MNTFSYVGTMSWLKIGSRIVLFLTVFLAGCVTTTDNPQQPLNLNKAERTHVQAGLGYLRQGDKESARRHFHKALKLNKNSAGANEGLANLYRMEGQDELADSYFRKAISLEPDFSQARNNYGSFLFSQKRYSDAEKHLEKASQDYSYDNRYTALLNLGRTQLQLGKTEAAESSFKQVIGINNRIAGPYLELADIYFAEKNYSQAQQYLNQFGKLSRQSPRSLWLGIRIERIFGNKNKEASYVLALKNLHPYSAEYLEYKKTVSP
ncbi:type IV pilus biogenesis/stability protein PilW [Pseudomaricurvus hydrocarbonicus]